jgi:hypothetical protein
MNIYCRGTARIRNRMTTEIYEIKREELDWDAIGCGERQMGSEVHHQATLEHPDLGSLNWSIWEYPVGAENYRETDVGEHELIRDFEYGLEHEEPEPDDWNAYPLPDNPFTTFLASWQQTSDFLASQGSDDGSHLLNRMVFSHQITGLEAYLGDTLLKEVLRDKNAMMRLMQKDSDLSQVKFTLSDIAAQPDLVEKRVREYLRSILYHNLAKADALYRIALQVRLLALVETEKDELFEAVQLRHDCIHRNGFDKDGNKLRVFTRRFVQERSNLIKDFVEKIEEAIRLHQFEQRGPKESPEG